MPKETRLTNQEQVPAGRHEDAADLLQRSFEHVEQLLHQLEFGEATGSGAAGGTASVSAGPALDRAGEPDAAPQTGVNGHRAAVSVPVGSTVEAEALRITLSACEEANRIRAEAAQLGAEAAAEGERLLAEAKRVSERLQADAWADAGRMREQATQTIDDARAEAERLAHELIAEATAAADDLRATAREEANSILSDAREWAAQRSTEAESMAGQRLDAAERDAEQIRQTAREMAQTEAERQLETQARLAVESSRPSDAKVERAPPSGQGHALVFDGPDKVRRPLGGLFRGNRQ